MCHIAIGIIIGLGISLTIYTLCKQDLTKIVDTLLIIFMVILFTCMAILLVVITYEFSGFLLNDGFAKLFQDEDEQLKIEMNIDSLK